MTKGYFEFEYLKRRDLNDEVQKVVQNYLNIYNSISGTVDYFANLPSASANLDKIWLVRYATTVLGIITKQAGLYISNGTNWNWMTSLEAKADKNRLISAGNGLTGGGDLSADRIISHNDTSSQANVVNTGGNVLQSADLDDFGHITSFLSIDLDSRYVLLSGAYANPTWITSLGANKLTGTIPSNVLSGSTLYIGTTAIALNRASGNQALTGISSMQFTGATSGTSTLQAPAVAGTTTFTLPATSGNLIGSGDVGTVTNTMLAGSIADTKLNTITTAGKVANSATTATNLNTANAIVSRDASGNFSAGTITGALSGNSTTATTLQTARTINGTSFNGSANITITANTPNALTISSPLTGGSFNGGSAISIGIETASSILSGALSSTDWNTFNNKQNTITLTTTGNSGASTFISNTLNIPNYTLAGLGGQPLLNGTGLVKSTAGTISYLTDNSSNWNTAYDRSSTALSVTGTTTKTITLTKQDGTTLTANWSDLNTDAVTSVFGRTGAVVATEGDYSLDLLGDTTITSPTTDQLLKYNGNNWVNWTANYLTLSSLSATSPLSYNNTTGQFSITQATTSSNGFLSSTDWNTFNNKQNTITLTTTGNSGASTFASNVLNIPNYTLAGLGGLALTGGTLTGQLISTLANNTGTGQGQIYLNGATANRIDFNVNGLAIPSFNTRSLGTKIVLYPAVSASSVDYAIGLEPSPGSIWFSVPTTASNFNFYAGITKIASLSGAGVLTASSFAGSLSGNANTATLLRAGNANFYTNTLPANTGGTDTYIYVGRWNTTQTNEKLSLKILYNNSLLVDTRRTSEYIFYFNTSNGINFTTGSTGNFFGWGRGFVLGEGGALDTANARVIQVSNTEYDFYISVLTGVTSGTGCYAVNISGGSWSHSGTNFGSTIPTGNSYILYLDNILTNYMNATFYSIAGIETITAAKSWNANDNQAAILMAGDIGSRIEFQDIGSSAPTLTTRSVGSKIVLRPTTSATLVDYGIGIETSSMWFSVSSTSDQHRFYAGTTSVARIRNEGIQTRATLYQGNAAFTALNTTATLTIAQILTLVIESTPTANITFTLPTGTNTDAGVMSSLETFASFTWSIVNRATGFTITIAGNTGNTYIGNTTIAANTSASFRTQKTAANTFKTVRI